jgi:hypothetical protein
MNGAKPLVAARRGREARLEREYIDAARVD